MLSWLVLCHGQQFVCSVRVKVGGVVTSVLREQCREQTGPAMKCFQECGCSAFVRLLLMFVFLTKQNSVVPFVDAPSHIRFFKSFLFPEKKKEEMVLKFD